MKKIFMPVTAVLFLAMTIYAQENETKQVQKSSTGKDSFIMEAASGGLMEVELGKLAKDKAESQEVKDFGERMVTDHSKANDELKDVAQKSNITLPMKMMDKHQKMVDKLSSLSGKKFDQEYMKMMVKDHKEDVKKFEEASETEKNSEVKSWVEKTLPVLREHLDMAKETNSKINKGKMDTDDDKDSDDRSK